MPTLNTRENFMRLAYRQVPEYIPTYSLFWAVNGPPFLRRMPTEGEPMVDMFGVELVTDKDGIVNAPMPKTSDFLLTDITKWRDIVKIPDYDFSDSAWAETGKQSIDTRDPELPCGGGVNAGWFQTLVSLMGFTEGLSACFEEPEEVKALMEYLTDWSVEMTKKYIHYYKPDFGFIADDIAHERNPFLSLPMFQELIAPYWRRYYSVFVEAGLPVGMHNCGHFELYLDDLVDMGCSFWDPVQSSNDAVAIKGKFGNDLGLCGGPETRFYDDDTTEEQVKNDVREHIMKLAPGGGFAMMAFVGDIDEDNPPMPGMSKAAIQRLRWTSEVFDELRWDMYK